MKELKGCPFCGGKAEIVRRTVKSVELVFIKCEACGATGKVYQIPSNLISPRVKTDDAIFDKVRENWNTRVEG